MAGTNNERGRVRQRVQRAQASLVCLACSMFFVPTTFALTSRQEAKAARPRVVGKKSAARSAAAAATRTRRVRHKPLTATEIGEAELRLGQLGYWVAQADGRWDAATRHALTAFQKVSGLPPTGRLTRADYESLIFAERPAAREGGPAHVEIDLRRQVLFVVDDSGEVGKVLPVSTGSGAEFESEGWVRDAFTPPGRFHVFNKIPGWRKSPMGMLYYPNYILGGIAIHGAESVPAKPASHGCIRVPLFAAARLYKLLPVGTPVIVFTGVVPLPAFNLTTPYQHPAAH